MVHKLLGKKTLVTGAGGFIGSHLCEELVREGAHVKALVKYNARSDIGNLVFLPKDILNQIEIVFGNVEDSFFVDTVCEDIDYIFHLAALIGIPYSYVAPLSYIRTNINGTLNLLEAMRKNDITRILHTSTSEVYGTADYAPINEAHPLKGQSPYSASKIGADKIAESYYRSFDVPIVTVRPFNTYGPHQSARAVIPTIISQALKSDRIRLGSLDPQRDMTYVRDTARGFISAAVAPNVEGETFNLGIGQTSSIGDIAKMIFEIMGRDIAIELDQDRVRPDKSEVFKLISDNSKAKDILRWEPEVSLKEGLEKTIEHIQKHIDYYSVDRYII